MNVVRFATSVDRPVLAASGPQDDVLLQGSYTSDSGRLNNLR